MAVCGQCHAQADLHPRKSRYPLYKRLGGSQSWSGQVRKISPTPEFNPRPVQSVVTRYTDYAISAHGRGECYCMMFCVQFGSGTERSALIIVCFVSSLFLLLATAFLRALVL